MEDTLRLYVGNLPYAAQKNDIEKLFSENNIPMYVTQSMKQQVKGTDNAAA